MRPNAAQTVTVSRPHFLPEAHQGIHDSSVGLEKRQGLHEDVEREEGHKHAFLAETLLHRELIRVLSVVEQHTCPHAIVKLADDRNAAYQSG